MEEITSGTSIQDLRARLTDKNDTIECKEQLLSETKNQIPEDLIQIQAYIRWEKAGKPNYSGDQQLKEFEEARKELQSELGNGTSTDGIRKKITKGEIRTNVSKHVTGKYFTVERIQRKNRDLMQLINKHSAGSVEEKISVVAVKPRDLSLMEHFVQKKEEEAGCPIVNKKKFRLADKELVVLVTKPAGKTNVHLVTDLTQRVTLHWALSKKPGEWLLPPPNLLPPGSTSLEKASETQFVCIFDDPNYKVQSLEIEIEDDNFVGMPFVLLSGGKWIKNDGSDFYVEFGVGTKQAQKDAGDGRGTAKVLLDKIADRECEAQKSFMHRFNITADLLDEAKDAGELGFAGILVWMRFMATRQLIWNKNYNVKPREISRAQDRLTDLLQRVYGTHPQHRELLRLILSTVGRGGEGDVGQRIRDEILVIQAVHSGTDLESVVSNCIGYRSEGKGFMVGVQINPVSGLPSGFQELLQFVLDHGQDKNVEALLEGLLEAREELRPLLVKSNDRLRDLLFLDIALDSSIRTAVERGYEELNRAKPEKIMYFITLVLENLALSWDENEDLIYCLKGWNQDLSMLKNCDSHWALYAKSVLDKSRLALASKAEWYQYLLQPSAEYLGSSTLYPNVS